VKPALMHGEVRQMTLCFEQPKHEQPKRLTCPTWFVSLQMCFQRSCHLGYHLSVLWSML
jgi:hypothetical protein